MLTYADVCWLEQARILTPEEVWLSNVMDQLSGRDSSKPSTYVALQVCRLSLSLCFRMLTYADVC
jgi:hypothetical protein